MSHQESGGKHREAAQFFDNELVKKLTESGIENIEWAFDSGEETDLRGEKIDAQINWLKLDRPAGEKFKDIPDVECKLYSPAKPNGELIIFTPGTPGGNGGRFETLYAKTFVDAGYAFCTIRHNGTSLTNGEDTAEVINSKKRLSIAKESGEHHIGGTKEEGYGPIGVVNETVNPLLALYKNFEKVHLMGHSMGVSASYNALSRTENIPDVVKKIGNMVSIAGYVGKTGEREPGIWDGMKMPSEELIDFELEHGKGDDVNMCSREIYKKELMEVARTNEQMSVPKHVNNVLIFTPEDPLIAGPDESKQRFEKDEYVTGYGPNTTRKLIIRDETRLGEKKPHSMRWICPSNLLRALKVELPIEGKENGPYYMVAKKDAVQVRRGGKIVERDWKMWKPVSRPYISPED